MPSTRHSQLRSSWQELAGVFFLARCHTQPELLTSRHLPTHPKRLSPGSAATGRSRLFLRAPTWTDTRFIRPKTPCIDRDSSVGPSLGWPCQLCHCNPPRSVSSPRTCSAPRLELCPEPWHNPRFSSQPHAVCRLMQPTRVNEHIRVVLVLPASFTPGAAPTLSDLHWPKIDPIRCPTQGIARCDLSPCTRCRRDTPEAGKTPKNNHGLGLLPPLPHEKR